MIEDYLIGIDIGTTTVKAGLFTIQGSPVDHIAIPYSHRLYSYVREILVGVILLVAVAISALNLKVKQLP